MDKVIKVNFTVGQGTDWPKTNLEDFARSLNKNLTKTKKGEASGKLKEGAFIVTIRNSSIEVVQS